MSTEKERTRGIAPVTYISLNAGPVAEVDGAVVEESLACISLNGTELATFMCTPNELDLLALGFLYNEGLISGLEDVRQLHIARNNSCVDVWHRRSDIEPPRRVIVTAGCGGGVTFDDLSGAHPPLVSDLAVTPDQVATLMRAMHLGAELYRQSRGIHTAALANAGGILLQVEDVGRHNCLDKLCGAALRAGIETRDMLILSSGRISSEMLNKARRLGAPIICSRTSPTSLSVALAESWNMTIIAYVRQDRMRIYSHPERVLGITPGGSGDTASGPGTEASPAHSIEAEHGDDYE